MVLFLRVLIVTLAIFIWPSRGYCNPPTQPTQPSYRSLAPKYYSQEEEQRYRDYIEYRLEKLSR